MKNKLTINSLAKNNIKHRKKQYTIMIIGILLSMIFSSTAIFFASSMVTSTNEYFKNNYGNCDNIFYHKDADKDFYEQGVEMNVIKDYGFAHIIGRIYPERDSEELNLNISYLDEKAKELYNISVLEGEYPTKPGEIALEKSALELINPDLKIGDVFTVYMKGQNVDTHLDGLEERTYRLVGILRNKRVNILRDNGGSVDFLPSAFVCDNSDAISGSKEANIAYINTVNKDFGEYNWYSYTSDAGLFGENNNSMHMHLDSYKHDFQYSNTYIIMVLVCVFAVILLLASVIAIINAMNSNIADRKKQIGMLRTVGATKRQIRKIFSREAIIISLFCTPISLLIAFVVVKSMSGIFGEDFAFTLNIPVLLLSGVFSVMCVALASIIPVGTASKVSPVQSIRNIEVMRKMKSKKIKSKKSFNVSSLMAKRNLTFYRRKQAIVSIFLIITIVSSCLGFSFLKGEVKYINEDQLDDYEIDANDTYGLIYNYKSGSLTGFSENTKQAIWDMSYFKDVSGIKRCIGAFEVNEYSDYMSLMAEYCGRIRDVTDEEMRELKSDCQVNKELFDICIESIEINELEDLEQYITDGEIDIDRINSGKEAILLAPNKVAHTQIIENGEVSRTLFKFDENADKSAEYTEIAERDINVGDKYTLDVVFTNKVDTNPETTVELVKNEVEISAHIKSVPEESKIGNYDNIVLITTHEGMKNLTENKVGYSKLHLTLKDAYKENMTDELDKVITEKLEVITMNSISYLFSNYNSETGNYLTFASLFLTLISIMALLLAGSISIINNSLTARIRESKREMGTLRAVGATQKDLTLSYVRQLLSMFGWGTVIGFGIFFMAYAGIQNYNSVRLENSVPIHIELYIWPAIVATVLLLVICSLNLYFKIKKETKNSIIENIREL